MIKNFLRDEDGMGTVELVLIIAVLVSIAIIFRNQVIGFVRTQLSSVFKSGVEGSNVTETVGEVAPAGQTN